MALGAGGGAALAKGLAKGSKPGKAMAALGALGGIGGALGGHKLGKEVDVARRPRHLSNISYTRYQPKNRRLPLAKGKPYKPK
jgi:hypothetical protein